MRAYLEPEDVEAIEKVAICLRDKLLIRLLFRLGCRISEALSIGVDDVDTNQGTVTILHLKTRTKLLCPMCKASLAKSYEYCPKCSARVTEVITGQKEHPRLRTLPVDAETLETLREFIKRGGPVQKNGKRLIFGINRHRAWQIVRDCAEKVGLPKLVNPETGRTHGVSPHRLRDAFAVHAVKLDDSGDGLRLLQEHLGHASFNTTARYRKVSGKEHRDWYRKLWQKDGS